MRRIQRCAPVPNGAHLRIIWDDTLLGKSPSGERLQRGERRRLSPQEGRQDAMTACACSVREPGLPLHRVLKVAQPSWL
jgi:hypothetical protein